MFTSSQRELLLKSTCKAIIYWVAQKRNLIIVVIEYVEVLNRVSAENYVNIEF